MILYPAIDLLDGKAVRLAQGDFASACQVSDDPERALTAFANAGATHLHIVDLSGARSPDDRQLVLLKRLLAIQPSLRVQVGGGVRTLSDVGGLLELGADRVVLGSAVSKDPAFAAEALREFSAKRITFAIDVRVADDGVPMAMVDGWRTATGRSFAELIKPYLQLGIERVLCTDVGVDGLMTGPNLLLYRSLKAAYPTLSIQASGGVSSLDDLRALRTLNIESAIVGKALYSGAFDVPEALAIC